MAMLEDVKLGGGLARTAIQAALERRGESLQTMRSRVAELRGVESAVPRPEGSGFVQALEKGIQATDQHVRAVDDMPLRVLRGELDLHEAAAQIQSSRIAFEFTMEVRNKFIDAYREIMRMSV